MPAARQARPRTLTVERIVETAVGITEAEGVEAMSMRRLAQALGVTPMALYGHVGDKHDLLDLIADRYLGELELPGDDVPWEEWLGGLFGSLHVLMRQRPVLAQVLVNQPVKARAARSMADATLGVLRANGFEDRLAVEVFVVLASYTVGFTLNQTARLRPPERTADDQLRSLRERGSEYPHLAAAAEPFVNWPYHDLFDHGLRLLIGAYAHQPGGEEGISGPGPVAGCR
ncbi:MAG: TetR/AcrR family transcriptional regulator [Acidimicrobiia bacterium]